MVSPPDWLSQFVDSVTAHIHSYDVLSPLGCHFHQVENVWEVTVFASRTEIVGGSQDGRTRNSYFNVDVKSVLDVFSRVDAIAWQAQALGRQDELGAHLAVEGSYEQHLVWLRITATSPRRFGIGRRAIINQGQIEELW